MSGIGYCSGAITVTGTGTKTGTGAGAFSEISAGSGDGVGFSAEFSFGASAVGLYTWGCGDGPLWLSTRNYVWDGCCRDEMLEFSFWNFGDDDI